MVSILEAKKEVQQILLGIEEVQGVGISTDREYLIIYVSNITDNVLQNVPPNIGGYPTVIKEVGIFTPTEEFAGEATDYYRRHKFRPIVGGISAGHYLITAGTLGCIVQDETSNNPMVLSNNHVFANTSTVGNQRAVVGDSIYQPGPIDGGTSNDTVATLARWIALKTNEANVVDAAIGTPLEEPSPYILKSESEYIEINGLNTVSRGITVNKTGRTSGYTTGEITDVDYTGYVDYNGELILFTDQILAIIKVEGGDSGSIMLDENNNAVGLVFAGSQDNQGTYYCLANKINTVFSLLKIELPTGEGPEEPEEPEEPSTDWAAIGFCAMALLLTGIIITKK